METSSLAMVALSHAKSKTSHSVVTVSATTVKNVTMATHVITMDVPTSASMRGDTVEMELSKLPFENSVTMATQKMEMAVLEPAPSNPLLLVAMASSIRRPNSVMMAPSTPILLLPAVPTVSPLAVETLSSISMKHATMAIRRMEMAAQLFVA